MLDGEPVRPVVVLWMLVTVSEILWLGCPCGTPAGAFGPSPNGPGLITLAWRPTTATSPCCSSWLAHTGVIPAHIGHAYPATEVPYALVAGVSPHCLRWPEVGI